ncbi:MAG: sugar ABC transporter substrate-binding protein [Candidatus Saganbacteria bacterium]|nr:sugar ABC transporter substrate-binding protein [Candidatus Saganbacteria bacterium]
MFKKIILSLVIFSLCFLNLSCTPAPSDGTVSLKMWVMPNSLEPLNDLKDVLKPFEKANPKIKIKVTVIDWGAAWTKITTAATSNDVPDIVQLGSTWVGAISAMDALLDVSDRVDEIGGSKAFVPAAWKTSGIIGSGKVTAIPWIVDCRALYYRTDIFKKVGLKKSDLDTWSGFKDSLSKIKDANLTIEGLKIVSLGMPGKNDWNVVHNLSPWIWAAGGDYLAKDNKTSTLNSKKALKGIMFYLQLAKEGYVPTEYLELNTAQVSSNFNNGSVGVYFDGPYEVKTLTTPPQQGGASGGVTARNFGVTTYPKGPKGRYTFVGGSNLAIFKDSKHKEEAWKVIKHLTSDKKAQLNYTKACGFLPAKLEVFDHPYYSINPARKILKEAIKYGKTYPCIPGWGLLEPILTRRFGIMWDYVTGSKGPIKEKEIQRQLDLAKQEMEAVLSQGRRR